MGYQDLRDWLGREGKGMGKRWPPQTVVSITVIFAGLSAFLILPKEGVAILRRAFKFVTEDPGFKADFKKTLGMPVNAIVGERAKEVVSTSLKQLYEDHKEGVDYLRDLPKRKYRGWGW